MLMPVEQENLQAIKAIGRSDVVLKLEVIKKTVGVLLIVCSIPFGVEAIAVSMLISSIFSAIANAFPNRKLIGYSYKQQINDILPTLILSAVMFAVIYPLNYLDINIYVLALVQVSVGVLIYVGLAAIFKIESFMYLINILKGFLNKKKRAVGEIKKTEISED